MKTNRVLSFWARTAPKTPMQRVGALLVALISGLSTAIIMMTIVDVSGGPWTVAGFSSSAFGIGVILLLFPIGVAHGLTACYPKLLEPWQRKPIGRAEEFKEHFAEDVRGLYFVIGWLFAIGTAGLLVYVFVLLAF